MCLPVSWQEQHGLAKKRALLYRCGRGAVWRLEVVATRNFQLLYGIQAGSPNNGYSGIVHDLTA